MTKTFKIPLYLHIKAYNKEIAEAMAEISCYTATMACRKVFGQIISDSTTLVISNGEAEEADIPDRESYSKEIILKAYREDLALSFLNSITDLIHPE